MGSSVVACGIFSGVMRTLSRGAWDLVPWPGIEPRPPALGARSLIHCATREVPRLFICGSYSCVSSVFGGRYDKCCLSDSHMVQQPAKEKHRLISMIRLRCLSHCVIIITRGLDYNSNITWDMDCLVGVVCGCTGGWGMVISFHCVIICLTFYLRGKTIAPHTFTVPSMWPWHY